MMSGHASLVSAPGCSRRRGSVPSSLLPCATCRGNAGVAERGRGIAASHACRTLLQPWSPYVPLTGQALPRRRLQLLIHSRREAAPIPETRQQTQRKLKQSVQLLGRYRRSKRIDSSSRVVRKPRELLLNKVMLRFLP